MRCLLLLIMALCGYAQPRFEDYPVEEIFKGKPAAPIITAPEERLYRTRIRQGVEKGWGVIRDGKEQSGPNFAGRYIVVEWGCGVPCVMMVIADAQTGKLHRMPMAMGTARDQKLGVPFFGLRTAEVEFRLTSRLLTMDACPEQSERPDPKCYRYYYLWDAEKWKLLRQTQIASPLFDAQ